MFDCFFRRIIAMDPETAGGQKPQECAQDIVRAVLRGDKEIIPLKYIPVLWLRVIIPTVYFEAMKQRAHKLVARYNATQHPTQVV